MSSSKKLIGTSIITAIAASLCCITPVLALMAGTSGLASTFSWMEPLRPYLIAFTIIVLAIAWYRQLQPKKQELDCACEEEKPKFITSKKFLFLVTLFAGFMLAFPYYTPIFYPNNAKEVVYVSDSNSNEVAYSVKGMTCSGCELHIESAVNKLDGILEVKADYEKGTARVKYDTTKVTPKAIEDAVGTTGYKILK